MRWTVPIMAVAAMAATPAAAQGVKLAPGEEVAFTLDGGAPRDPARASVTPTAFEDAVGRKYSGLTPPPAPVTEGVPIANDGSLPATPTPSPDMLRFRFMRVAGTSHSLLVIHNGYSRALVYRAGMSVQGKKSPTDVCLVMPAGLGIEHWPYAIDALELSGFALVSWKPEDGVPCK